ncbi:methyl-accepting chemotaxis protein [Cohnella sp. CFH 77786]|uniref:methyl-accepting chemotaxis protein n=1 Tax=Cohnella sp. CFH 77786 TaxID=2662265 RepID=UPI001C60BC98|nr:methyl-accepting chemotaxis protein [Cohnella sp. CFH 77786]
MKLTIGKKLMIGFAVVLALFITNAVVSTRTMLNMGKEAENLQDRVIPKITLLGDMKSDIVNIERLALRLAIDGDAGQKKLLEGQINVAIQDLLSLQKKYDSQDVAGEENRLRAVLTANEQTMGTLMPKLIDAGKANDTATANRVAGELKTPFDNALSTIENIIALNKQVSDASLDVTIKHNRTGIGFVTLVSVFALLLGVLIVILMSRMITKPIVRMAKAAKRISEGDLTGDAIRVKNRDEIGDLARSFNEMSGSLRGLIRQLERSAGHVAASAENLSSGTEQISKASGQIVSTIENVAARSDEQMRSLRESAASVGEMSVGAGHIASNAENVTENAVRAARLATEGNDKIRDTVRQMDAVEQTVNRLAQAVGGLGERSEQIGQIVQVMTGIASQTKLLALNASIEAARALEHGSGFAVVAAEVRKLAEQSAESAGQIAQMVSAIQEETSRTVRLMAAGKQEVTEGILAVNLAGQAFEQIQHAAAQVAQQMQEVSAAAEQMSAGTEQMVLSIGVISDAADTTASGMRDVSSFVEEQLASMEEINASASALSDMSVELRALVGQFQV